MQFMSDTQTLPFFKVTMLANSLHFNNVSFLSNSEDMCKLENLYETSLVWSPQNNYSQDSSQENGTAKMTGREIVEEELF